MAFANRIVLAALLVLVAPGHRPAAAAWGGLVGLGALQLFSDPSCAADGTGTAVCAAVGTASSLIVNRYAGGKWGKWTALSGMIGGKPGCARIAPGKVLCGVRSQQNGLLAYTWSAGAWTGPSAVGGVLSTDPSCAALATGHALCAALDSNGNMFSATFNGTAWALLPAAQATAFSPVGCTPDDRGHAICVWTGALGHVMAREYNGTKWLAALDLGGVADTAPACIESGLKSGAMTCYATGNDQSAYYDNFSGAAWGAGDWAGWANFGGTLTGIGCAQDGSNGLVLSNACVATGVVPFTTATVPYGELWGFGAAQLGGAPSWGPLGGQVLGLPSCVPLNTTVSPGRVMCVVRTLGDTAISVIEP